MVVTRRLTLATPSRVFGFHGGHLIMVVTGHRLSCYAHHLELLAIMLVAETNPFLAVTHLRFLGAHGG